MRQVNIHEAKTHLSKLIASGEEVVIARYGQPVARLLPIRRETSRREPGSARGKVRISKAFFEPLPQDIIEAFEK